MNDEIIFFNNNKQYYPINDNIELTHKMYDEALYFSINEIYNNKNYYIVIATHNDNSVKYSCEIINKYNMNTNTDNIHFSQLHGMYNYISLSLAKNGFNTSKYIPFGEIELTLPYLTRRLQENSSIFNNTSKDINLMLKELATRVKN